MDKRIPLFSLTCKIVLFCLCGCYKNHLYVQQEWIDREFLASSHVKTPDPRQEHPPQGQRLLVSWDFPRSQFIQPMTLVATVRFWDNTQTALTYPMERKRDYIAFYFPNDRPETDRRILTYRVQIVDHKGQVIETWNHHFWTELIDVDRSAANFKSLSVSSQPKQESVMETP